MTELLDMPQTLGHEAVLQVGRSVLDERYPGALTAIVAGSLIKGGGNEQSDIDLVVLFDHLPNAYRESFLWAETPIEAFVHDLETLRWFLRADAESGRPAMIDMVREGIAVGPHTASCQSLKYYAESLRAAGPPVLRSAAMSALRYRITDLLDDLRSDRPSSEIQALGCALYEPAADLMLRSRGHWAARGKWIPRSLKEIDEQLGSRFVAAFANLFSNQDASAIISLMTQELNRNGGPLFAGDRRDAPASWRG